LDTTLPQPAIAATSRAQRIELEAFDALVARHQRRIYRLLLAIVRDPDAADTLTQECFLRAYRGRGAFRGDAAPETWLLRIAVNLARDHIRSGRQGFWRRLVRGEDAAAEAVADRCVSPERLLQVREELVAVQAVVDALPLRQRTVFILRFSEEMTLEEIAETMRLELGTVKSHLARALQAVRERVRG
jgi:RNA polymerase sigma-70 factor (ECF subfamily)